MVVSVVVDGSVVVMIVVGVVVGVVTSHPTNPPVACAETIAFSVVAAYSHCAVAIVMVVPMHTASKVTSAPGPANLG